MEWAASLVVVARSNENNTKRFSQCKVADRARAHRKRAGGRGKSTVCK